MIGLHHTDVFWSEASAATGAIPMPEPDEPARHAHAVCVIGYARPCDRARACLAPGRLGRDNVYYEVRNSAGAEWGDDGPFWIPAAYLESPHLAGDAWTIRK